jgi:hypothetical protein
LDQAKIPKCSNVRYLVIGWAIFGLDFVLMPIAYYPTFLCYHSPGTTDFNFLHFSWHTLTSLAVRVSMVLWVLRALDAIAAPLGRRAPGDRRAQATHAAVQFFGHTGHRRDCYQTA